jgi:hypothetical protein
MLCTGLTTGRLQALWNHLMHVRIDCETAPHDTSKAIGRRATSMMQYKEQTEDMGVQTVVAPLLRPPT